MQLAVPLRTTHQEVKQKMTTHVLHSVFAHAQDTAQFKANKPYTVYLRTSLYLRARILFLITLQEKK